MPSGIRQDARCVNERPSARRIGERGHAKLCYGRLRKIAGQYDIKERNRKAAQHPEDGTRGSHALPPDPEHEGRKQSRRRERERPRQHGSSFERLGCNCIAGASCDNDHETTRQQDAGLCNARSALRGTLNTGRKRSGHGEKQRARRRGSGACGDCRHQSGHDAARFQCRGAACDSRIGRERKYKNGDEKQRPGSPFACVINAACCERMHDDMGQRCRSSHQANDEFKITDCGTDVKRDAARARRRYKPQSLHQDIDGLHDRVVGRLCRRIERLRRKEKKNGKAADEQYRVLRRL